MSFKELQELVFEEYKKNGYLESWTTKNKKNQLIFDIAELGLIVTEVSEAMEAIRKDDYINLTEELADIIIRVMNFSTRKGFYDLTGFIEFKNKKNIKREKLHGKKV